MTYKAFEKQGLGFTTRQLHAGYDPAENRPVPDELKGSLVIDSFQLTFEF